MYVIHGKQLTKFLVTVFLTKCKAMNLRIRSRWILYNYVWGGSKGEGVLPPPFFPSFFYGVGAGVPDSIKRGEHCDHSCEERKA